MANDLFTFIVFLQSGPRYPEEVFEFMVPGIFASPFLILIIPPYSAIASKSTTTGDFVGEKQCGNIHAFLPFLIKLPANEGFGSTSNPVQLYFNSKYSVLEISSPSIAPASMKKGATFGVGCSPVIEIGFE